MKTLFILALISLAVTNIVAQLDTTCSHGCGQCQQQQQWHHQMNTCRAFLKQCGPVTTPFVRSQMWQASSCQVMQQQCCQQLAQISEQARCQAVCSVAQPIMQQQQQGQSFFQPQQQVQFEMMRMVLHTLASMCNVYIPEYCATTPCSTNTPCSIPMAATCAGGACC